MLCAFIISIYLVKQLIGFQKLSLKKRAKIFPREKIKFEH